LLTDILCCPRCAGALVDEVGGARCDRCTSFYPRFGRIPCLFDDPALWRTLWLRRLDDYTTTVESRVQELQREAESEQLLPRTRARLLRIANGFTQQIEGVTALFEPLDEGTDEMTASAFPSRPEATLQPAILECYEHIFRDWAWGERECAMALDFVKPMVPAGLDRIALYGAGAGRLAVDIHQTCAPKRTLALDVNPLPFLAADKLLSGETVDLPEFPVDPNSDDAVVVMRHLERPFAVREGFSFVFADALRAPIPAGSLDAVVTSWFIDVTRVDLRLTAAAINRVLRPGGLWVNFGPLRFQADRGGPRDRRRDGVRARVARSAGASLLPFADQRIAPDGHRVPFRRAQDRRRARRRDPGSDAALGREPPRADSDHAVADLARPHVDVHDRGARHDRRSAVGRRRGAGARQGVGRRAGAPAGRAARVPGAATGLTRSRGRAKVELRTGAIVTLAACGLDGLLLR
jgi:hypothetical protein